MEKLRREERGGEDETYKSTVGATMPMTSFKHADTKTAVAGVVADTVVCVVIEGAVRVFVIGIWCW